MSESHTAISTDLRMGALRAHSFARGQGLVRTLRNFARAKPLGAIGGFLIVLVTLVAVFASLLAPHDPAQFVSRPLQEPNETLLLGSDQLGRDVLSRVLYGSRLALVVGVSSVALGVSLGATLGLLSGYFGGGFSLVLERFVDIMLAFPTLILALVVIAIFGASLVNVIVAVAYAMVPSTARTLRSAVLSAREQDYVMAARAIGCSNIRIMFRHILPNLVGLYIVLFSLHLGSAIIYESSLSFLGLGVPPQIPSWGGMISVGLKDVVRGAWWTTMYAGIALALVVYGFNLLGDAIRDVLDPRLRSGR